MYNLIINLGELGSEMRRAERIASPGETVAGIPSKSRLQHAHGR